MRQGTTPSYAVTVAGYDLTDKTVFITLRGRMGRLVTKTGSDLTVTYDGTDSLIAFRLSQKETLYLPVGNVEIQARFIDSEGVAYATNIVQLSNLNILLNGEIDYKEG